MDIKSIAIKSMDRSTSASATQIEGTSSTSFLCSPRKSMDSKSMDSKSMDSKSMDSKSMDSKSMDSKLIDSKLIDIKLTDNKLTDNNTLLTICSEYIKSIVRENNIDDSHALLHHLDVVNLAMQIYNQEIKSKKKRYLIDQLHIILVSCALHDAFDNKYIKNYEEKLEDLYIIFQDIIPLKEIDIIKIIINTMSYSKVKKEGKEKLAEYLGEYSLAYHIVREADLLAAYDFDRCMVYTIYSKSSDMNTTFHEAHTLFKNRMFKHYEDKLFVTKFALRKGLQLENNAKKRINVWATILNITI